ncbi:MAG TPA: ABC transporter permease, partial [Thermoplasmata archaeon]|nr:ABC transporter permease [Thermoplasmata archaeon]
MLDPGNPFAQKALSAPREVATGRDGHLEAGSSLAPAMKPRWARLFQTQNRLQAQERRWNLVLSLPMTLFQAIFFIAPFAFIVLYAFGYYSRIGGPPTGEISLVNFNSIWNTGIVVILSRTAAVAGAVTALSFVLAYPAAYYMANLPPRTRGLVVMLLMIPFWTSFLLRTYGLINIFQGGGLANQFLIATGLSQDDVFQIRSLSSVVWAETYTFLPFMVLPLYATLERLDRSSIEASYLLGAGRVRTFFRVILPLSTPGILAGSLLVFIIAMGELVIPILVGGIEAQFLIGNAIYDLRGTSTGIAAALSLLLIAIILAVSLVYIR